MFRFVVHRLHWLARVPILPQLFDALLLAWTTLFHRRRLRAMEEVEDFVLQIPGMRTCVHRFGGIGFVCNGCEFAHLHGNGLLDVHLTRERAAAWIASGHAKPHHLFGPSAWVSYWMDSAGCVETAQALINEAIAITQEARRLRVLSL